MATITKKGPRRDSIETVHSRARQVSRRYPLDVTFLTPSQASQADLYNPDTVKPLLTHCHTSLDPHNPYLLAATKFKFTPKLTSHTPYPLITHSLSHPPVKRGSTVATLIVTNSMSLFISQITWYQSSNLNLLYFPSQLSLLVHFQGEALHGPE